MKPGSKVLPEGAWSSAEFSIKLPCHIATSTDRGTGCHRSRSANNVLAIVFFKGHLGVVSFAIYNCVPLLKVLIVQIVQLEKKLMSTKKSNNHISAFTLGNHPKSVSISKIKCKLHLTTFPMTLKTGLGRNQSELSIQPDNVMPTFHDPQLIPSLLLTARSLCQ